MRWILGVLYVCLSISLALAGPSGGRMGGGSWSSRPSSSSSSSSSSYHSTPTSSSSSSHSRSSTPSYSSSPSYTTSPSYSSSPSYSTTPTSYGGSSPSYSYSSPTTSYSSGFNFGSIFFMVGLVAVVGLVAFAWLRSPSGPSYEPMMMMDTPVFEGVDVGVMRIAIDGRARKFVQTELARIAKIADTATEDGRLAMLREVTLLLRRVRDAWVYGGAVNEPMRSLDAAKAAFDGHVDDARSRFQHETVSNVQGVKTSASAPEYTRRSDEGEGVILVSIIVAARTELFTITQIGDGEELRKALEAASHRPATDLVAIEIIWEPSEENDRMSSIELEAKYPRPDLIPITGALVGKAFCTYCGGPYPAELVSCPHCGAPAAHTS